jgi:hypothetical protein
MHFHLLKAYVLLSLSSVPLALGLNHSHHSPWGKPRISLPIAQQADPSEVSVQASKLGKCQEILSRLCPSTQPGCEGSFCELVFADNEIHGIL